VAIKFSIKVLNVVYAGTRSGALIFEYGQHLHSTASARNISCEHQHGKHGSEINLNNIRVKAKLRLENEASAVSYKKLPTSLKGFRFPLPSGNKNIAFPSCIKL
jgi:hypothetical protein